MVGMPPPTQAVNDYPRREMKAKAVIPSNPTAGTHDKVIYHPCNAIERCSNGLKYFRLCNRLRPKYQPIPCPRPSRMLHSRIARVMSAVDYNSYLSRKSSTCNFLKSGSAARSMSWSQSHQDNLTRRTAMASENRRRIGRAGLPATMV